MASTRKSKIKDKAFRKSELDLTNFLIAANCPLLLHVSINKKRSFSELFTVIETINQTNNKKNINDDLRFHIHVAACGGDNDLNSDWSNWMPRNKSSNASRCASSRSRDLKQ